MAQREQSPGRQETSVSVHSEIDRIDLRCEECGEVTPHQIRITFKESQPTDDTNGSSRTPIRVCTCPQCENERKDIVRDL